MRSVPQIIAIFAISQRVHKSVSPYYAHFLVTFVFVCFNKVITMQYYMWVFGALILLLPESSLYTNSFRRFQKAFGWLMQWLLGILLWVWLANKLEGEGVNAFSTLWIISLFKLGLDTWVLIGFMATITNRAGYQALPDSDPIPDPTVKSLKAKN